MREALTNQPSLYLRSISTALRLLPPAFPGKTRLARAILRDSLAVQDIEIQDRKGFSFLAPSLQDPIAFHLLIDGVYEPLTMRFLLNHLRPGMTFVDAGANIGIFTVPAARRVGPTGRVIAIEPSPSIFLYLKANLQRNNLSNVYLKQYAAYTDDVPEIPFYEAPADHFGMGSLAPQFNEPPITVRAMKLDQILAEEGIDHTDLLKVDVEGFEAAIFEGASYLLTGQDPPLIVFEFCDWAEARAPKSRIGDSQRFLIELGYRIWRLKDFLKLDGPSLTKVLVKGYEIMVAAKR